MDECNGIDTCDVQGECIAGTPSLEDGNPCTIGHCVFAGSIGAYIIDQVPAPPGTVCGDDDSDPCNGVLACNALASCSVRRGTDDANPCTADSCDPIGGIVNEPLPDGAACDDGNACTGSDTCGGGFCQSGGPVDVDDNPCTEDVCEPGGSIIHNPRPGLSCDDGDACNGVSICDANATCVPGTPEELDDGNPCTTDSCDPAIGPRHDFVSGGTLCSEPSDLCVTRTCDSAGTCRPPTVVNPDDGNPCTLDTCEPALGVAHSPVPAGISCADANLCDGTETCDGLGACVPGSPPQTDDGNNCTDDACEPTEGVVHVSSDPGKDCGLAMVCDGAGSCRHLPPDPASVAPPLDASVPTTVKASTRFLYTGSNPIQIGVSDETIGIKTAAVVRGTVIHADGSPLPGVAVTIKDRPELGMTFTRPDGEYDLAVNGGGTLTLNFAKPGYLSAQRKVAVDWDEFRVKEAVALVPVSSSAIHIDFSDGPLVAQSEPTIDVDGTRQATVIFQEGTQASMTLQSGETKPLETMNIRFTELSTGPNGPASLPGELPQSVDYGYVVDISADEAIAARATSVQFDRPAALYVDNFLEHPVGRAMPAATYDFSKAAWLGEADGIVLRVLGTSNGLAQLDLQGSGEPATQAQLDQLGFTSAELASVATHFMPGQSLVRQRISHFSRKAHCGVIFEEEVKWPSFYEGVGPEKERPKRDDDRCKEAGCEIDVAGQTLRQRVPVAGTPYVLSYSTRLMPGYRPETEIVFQLTGNEVLQSLAKVELIAEFAGRYEYVSFDPAPHLQHTIRWNGVHRYGYAPRGRTDLHTTIRYRYRGKAWVPVFHIEGQDAYTWATAHNVSVADAYNVQRQITVYPGLEDEWAGSIGATSTDLSSWDARGTGLGGWMLDANHIYDPTQFALIKGTGVVQKSLGLLGPVFKRIAGKDAPSAFRGGHNCGAVCCTSFGCPDEGLPAPQADLGKVLDALAMPDGSVVMLNGYQEGSGSELGLWIVMRRIDADGTIHTVNTVQNDPNLLALDFNLPWFGTPFQGYEDARLALGPDGGVYVGLSGRPSVLVWRFDFVSPNLVRSTRIAGSFEEGMLFGEDVPAFSAALGTAEACLQCPATIGGLAVASDGRVLVATTNLAAGARADKIYQVSVAGRVRTLAGTGERGFSGDGGPAAQAQLNRPSGLATGVDGSVYVADTFNNRVRVIGLGGIITTVAGNGASECTNCNDGVPARNSALSVVRDVTVPGAGGFYISEGRRVRFVEGANGLIRTVAGHLGDEGSSAATGAAIDLGLSTLRNQVIDTFPDGSVLIADRGQLFHVARQFPGIETSDLFLPSESGSEFYRFDPTGKHLDTRDTATGATVATFGYDASGKLATIADRAGNVTRIDHDASGQPTRIVAPFGQTTELGVDSNGFLSDIVDPLGGVFHSEYSDDGLMTSFRDPRGGLEEYAFDTLGRLASETAPDAASKVFTLAEAPGLRTVTSQTAMGRTATYRYETLSNGAVQRDVTAAGLTTTTIQSSGELITVSPDGTTRREVVSADPRFGMLLPFPSETIETLPSGLTRSVLRSKTFDGVESGFSETLFTNGRQTSVVFDAVTRTLTTRSPEGRVVRKTVDEHGRESRTAFGNLEPVDLTYDSHGRMSRVARGARLTEHTFFSDGDAAGYLSSVTDAIGVPTTFTRDALGRTLTEMRASAATSFGWDQSGNLLSVTPPGRPVHVMNYTPVNLLQAYEPPGVGLPASATSYAHDLDRMLRTETRPDGVSIVRTPDSSGRLDTVAIPGGFIDHDYVPSGAVSGAGKVSHIRGPYGVDLAFTYDGSLTTSMSWSGDVAGSVAWQYNNDFQKVLEVASGTTNAASTAFGYDNDLLLTCASPTTCSPPGADALRLTRHPQHGMVTNISLGETRETWSYNAFGELARQAATFSGLPLADFTYDEAGFERDQLGRIVRKTETILGVTKAYVYRYDPLGRLDQVKIDGVVDEEFTYDANGNRLTHLKQGMGAVSATYDDQDRVLTYGTWTFAYTPHGELERKTNIATSETWLFQYDALGNLVTASQPNGDLVEYLVDGMGRRVGKKKNGTLLKQWIYRDALNPVAELDGGGNLVALFVYGSRPNVPDYVLRGGVTYRVVSDHTGSPRYAVNIANANDVPTGASYSSFGEVTGSGLEWMPFGFAGGMYDADTGLVRFGLRDYDAAIGRWTNKDPIHFAGGQTNLYAYVNNDPVNAVDPSGKGPTACAAAIIACIGLSAYFFLDDLNDIDACKDAAEEAKRDIDSCDASPGGTVRRKRIEQEAREECLRQQWDYLFEIVADTACWGIAMAICVAPTI